MKYSITYVPKGIRTVPLSCTRCADVHCTEWNEHGTLQMDVPVPVVRRGRCCCCQPIPGIQQVTLVSVWLIVHSMRILVIAIMFESLHWQYISLRFSRTGDETYGSVWFVSHEGCEIILDVSTDKFMPL